MKAGRKTKTFEFEVSFDNSSFNDTLHEDGSKTYETLHNGYITIKNPEFVSLIEDLLKKDMRGYSYIPYIMKFIKDDKDIYNEYKNVLRVLD